MHFNKLDLNLLVAFDALARELNITRAAERMNISQPAMSHALRRLRTYFDDELLVQVGRRMELTSRAQFLHEAVADMLTRLEFTLSSTPAFDPSQSDRTFTISMSDYSLEMLGPKLRALAAAQHSKVKLHLLPQIEYPDRPLERGEVDLLIIPAGVCSPHHPSAPLFDERVVCVEWSGSQGAREPLTVERFVAAGHVAMIATEIMEPAFEKWVEEVYGTGRRIEATAYTFTSLPFLVVGTESLALVQYELAKSLLPALPILIHELPRPLPLIHQSMHWHKYRGDDPGLRWLRTLVQQAILPDVPAAMTH